MFLYKIKRRFAKKGQALKISSVIKLLLDRDGKCFYLLKYFLGGRLAGLREEWSNLRDNSSPSALSLTPFYDEVFSRLLKIRDLVSFNDWKNFVFSAKKIYLSLLTEHSSSPVLP